MEARHPNIKDWGVDADPKNRPGVPREVEPRKVRGAYWDQPEYQAGDVDPARPEYKQVTPVFGTGQPASGLSGKIRQAAYKVPEYRTMHWMALLLADRVNVVEWALGKRRDQGAARGGNARQSKGASLLLPIGSALAGLFVAKRFADRRGEKRDMRRVEFERRMHEEHLRDAMPIGWRMQPPVAGTRVARQPRAYQH